MGVKTAVKNIWQVLAGPEPLTVTAAAGARKTAALPSIMNPQRVGQAITPKPTAANLRRFAETPIARRAINVVKDRIASMDWQIKVRRGYLGVEIENAAERMNILRRCLEEPNANDSFRILWEQVLEDLLVGGIGAVEMELTGDAAQPFNLFPVDGATIQIDTNWNGDAASPRYAQATGRRGVQNLVPLLDDELMYLRLNPRT